MRSFANSTNGRNAVKPKKNIDVVKRSTQQELTATIPVSDSWIGKVVLDNATGLGVDVHTIGSLGLLNKSIIFRELCDCFDQFKIMDVHICGDVAKGVSTKIEFNVVFNKEYAYRVSTDSGTSFTNVSYDQLIAMITSGDLTKADKANDLLTYLNTNYAIGKKIEKPSNDKGPIGTQEVTFPCIYGMAAKRTIPSGFYQNNTDGNVVYAEPSYEEFASYSSYIYQSKMPGAPMHLSLDIQGVSSSEKMMTIPTILSGRLYEFKPEIQNGRFIPTILYGARASIPGVKNNSDNDKSDTRLLSVIQYFDDSQFEWNSDSSIKYTDVSTLQKGTAPTEQTPNALYPILKATTRIEITAYRGTVLPFIDNTKWTAYLNDIVTGATLNIDDNYLLKVMGYITVRFKQLRTTRNEVVETYSFMRWSISDGTHNYSEQIPLTGNGHYTTQNGSFDIFIRSKDSTWTALLGTSALSSNKYLYAIAFGSVNNSMRIFSSAAVDKNHAFDANSFINEVGSANVNNYSVIVGVNLNSDKLTGANTDKFAYNAGALNIGRTNSDEYYAASYASANSSSTTYVTKIDSISGKMIPLLTGN
ncbi:hypothetical protein EDI_113620 [Entamoeba dispar SAW760]|uniref:Uncharacterized protein n=1 Tax=Entamoeba dispar (strain ATCC PRA-260 / SAW760) TaxID=370354 RepID=B0ECL7_ENTDS|nr:uncharacterized protein EDI_113620 [Entamoeba dispar SAW760]EDR27723.1 hypothetical protein EDI_113620 [Entamoeba dispar SAW760]|eukprot:EDR27723.1 hypothetical protein EDI_113620 [Entamoeba dispar SAW760]